MRNLTIKVNSNGTSSSGIPLQEASISSKSMEGVDLKLVDSKVGRLHLGRPSNLEVRGGSPKARARQASTGGVQQLRREITPKPKQPHMSYVSVRIQLN
jgi:hypothetical protein